MWWIGSIAGLRCFGSMPVRFGRACDCCTLEEPSRAASCTSSPTTCYTGLQLQQLMSCYEGRVFVTINELHGTQCLRACLQPQCPHNPQSLCPRGRLNIYEVPLEKIASEQSGMAYHF